MNQQLLSDIGLGIFFILSIIYIVAYIFTKGQPLSKLQKYTKKKRTLNTVIPTFIDSLNRGDNIWAEYLSDTAQITSDLNAPYYVGKIIDFIDYAQQVDSQFTITKLNRKKTIITCTIVESNKWITNITSPSPKSQSSINHKG